MADGYDNLYTMPVGALGIIGMRGCEQLSASVDNYIHGWRRDMTTGPQSLSNGYLRDSYLIETHCPRFGTGEAKALISETIRGYDLFIIADMFNHGVRYKMYGEDVPMSPDDHFQDLKRIIAAAAGKARRITVIMTMLYEGRQHRRSARESLDCAMALQELVSMGVDNDHMMIISPDEGAMSRCIYYSSVLNLDLGMFYKRRDYSHVVNGKNPIIAHMFLGDNVEGKDVVIVDDMVASGDSILDIVSQLKERHARRIFICPTFGLFCEGLDRFDEAFEKGMFDGLFSTNLIYQTPELLSRPWYHSVDMSKYIAYIINILNHDASISPLLNPVQRIASLLERHELDLLRRDKKAHNA